VQKLLENWDKFLKETQNHWELEIAFTLEKDVNTYDIFQRIRAIPGITIVKSIRKITKIADVGQKAIVLSIKAIVHPYNLQNYMSNLYSTLKKIKDDEGDRILDIKVVRSPKKTDID